MGEIFEEDGRENSFQKRSPLGYKIIRRFSAALDPRNMASLGTDTLQTIYDAIPGIMHSKKRFSGKQGDRGKEQYEQILKKIVAVNKNEFLDFDMKVTCLEDFLAFYVCNSSLYKEFWYVYNFIDKVEGGFNVSQRTMVENLEELGLTSLRSVYDEIMYHGGEIKDYQVPTWLRTACQPSHQKYKNNLDRKRAELQKAEVTNKRKLLIEELNIVKERKIGEESLIKHLKDDSDKLIIEAGETSDVAQMK